MAETAGGGANIAAGGRYPYYYGPEGRLVLVDSALEAVNRGSTTIGIKTPAFALLASHIKPVRPLIDPAEKIFVIMHLMKIRLLFASFLKSLGFHCKLI